MREEQHQLAALLPLFLRRRDELIDDDLGTVGEVAELSLPQHEGVGSGRRVAVLEPEHRVLGEEAVVDQERSLGGVDVLQGRVLRAAVLIHQHGVALREGAPAGILTGQPHGDPLDEEGTEREKLGGPPVHFRLREHLPSLGELSRELRVDVEPFRHRSGALQDAIERRQRHRRGRRLGGRCRGRLGRQRNRREAALVCGRERGLHAVLEVLQGRFGLLQGEVAVVDEPLGVEFSHGAAVADLGVHDRLRVRGLVRFVVAPPTVADDVHHDVLPELAPEREREVHDVDARFRVLAVHVEDRGLDHLGDIGCVHRGSRVGGRGREADAVVDHDVDGPPRAVARQRAHVEGLGDDALTGESCIAVHEDRQHLLVPGIVSHVLQRSRHSLDDRVHRFEVAGVGGQRDVQLPTGGTRVRAGRAQVVLDVAGPLTGERVDVPFELPEDLLVALAENVGQNVEAAAVGRSEHDLCDAGLHRSGEYAIEHRYQGLEPFKGEALVADVLGVKKTLERLGGVEHRERTALAGGVQPPGRVRALDPPLDPRLLVRLLDEHVLDAERAAVRLAEDAQDLAQRGALVAADIEGVELPVEVPEREAVPFELKLRVGRDLGRKGVDVGHQVAADPVHVDERQHAGLLSHQRVHPAVGEVRVDVGREADRLVGHGEGLEDFLVVALLAGEQRRDPAQEFGALGALDHAVVVGAGQAQHLADSEVGESRGVRELVLGRVADAAGCHDQTLAGHQSRNGLRGAQHPRVGESHGGVGEVLGRKLACLRAPDQLVVRGEERRELERLGVLDARHHETARAVAPLDVHRDAEVDVLGRVAVGCALDLHEERPHARHPAERLHECPRQQVREAHLAAGELGKVLVHERPVLLQ